MKNVKITRPIAIAYTEAAAGIVNKRHATPKLSPKIYSLSVEGARRTRGERNNVWGKTYARHSRRSNYMTSRGGPGA